MKKFYEILPGLLTWATLILMVVASRFAPTGAAIFIILFDTYWLFKTIFMSFHMKFSFKNLNINMKINWLEKLKGLNKEWRDIYHVIILPMYDEPYEIVKETFESLRALNYPKDKIIVALGTEEKAGIEAKLTAEKIKEEYGEDFHSLTITNHALDANTEMPGKGSNETHIAKEVKRDIIDSQNIPYEKILVSVFDVDTQILPEYLSRLMYVFLTVENPQRASYQPIPLFHNNIFESPIFARVVATSATFWHMMQQARPEKMTTFSSHSMPFQALVDIGFWQKDIVSEDSRIFWQCYLHFDGDWRVEPLMYPVSMDANVAPTIFKTFKNVYKQQRRWAWGAENIPYVFVGFSKNKNISRRKKIFWIYHKIEAFHSWATNAVMIFALGWLPLWLGDAVFNDTILSFNLPQVTRWIMSFAALGIVSSAISGIILLPPKPAWFKKRHYFYYFIQWALMPATLILFGAIPAIEAQTRLMVGGKWKLNFWVTPKIRKAK